MQEQNWKARAEKEMLFSKNIKDTRRHHKYMEKEKEDEGKNLFTSHFGREFNNRWH